MIGLDTNVLVRYLAQDDARQGKRAIALIEEELSASRPGYISVVVLAELCWVLKRRYAATRREIADVLDDLLAMAVFVIERRDVVQLALQRFRADGRARSSFADFLIAELARDAGCADIFTFDKGAIRGAGSRLLA